MWSHPLWCFGHQNQNPKQYLCLDLHRVLFFSFFFSKLSTWSSCGITIIPWSSLAPSHGMSLSLHILSIEVSTRVSSIIQHQTRAFNNTFQNRISWTPLSYYCVLVSLIQYAKIFYYCVLVSLIQYKSLMPHYCFATANCNAIQIVLVKGTSNI